MPFYLSLSTFLMSLSFFAYGMLKHDSFIYVSKLTSPMIQSFSSEFFDILIWANVF